MDGGGDQFCTAAGAGQRVSRTGKSFPVSVVNFLRDAPSSGRRVLEGGRRGGVGKTHTQELCVHGYRTTSGKKVEKKGKTKKKRKRKY